MTQIITIESFSNPNESILRKKAKKVKFPLSVEVLSIVEKMEKKLYELGGVGLAAPQIDVKKNIICIYITKEASNQRGEDKAYDMHTIFNASYTGIGEKDSTDFEGCYSVSSQSGEVTRYSKIKFKYLDKDGTEHEEMAEGFYARVIQHEIDHVNGILIIDKLVN